MVYAWGVKWAHETQRPPNPHVNDTVAWASKWLMDDGVVLEPLVGLRPWLSMAALEEAMTQVWGAAAVNAAKRDAEGAFTYRQLLWGLWMDFLKFQVALPEPECLKAQYLLAEPALGSSARVLLRLSPLYSSLHTVLKQYVDCHEWFFG